MQFRSLQEDESGHLSALIQTPMHSIHQALALLKV
ncbi:hypothetical protein Q672_00530 [Marinobacter sp. EVN1]|nr:hypothetical protein Q672_00530 [Marinobacter sp. EVN1]